VQIGEKVTWNLSSQRRVFRDADAIVVSIPKSGRTWIRVVFRAYRAAAEGRDLVPGTELDENGFRPRIAFTHERWQQLTDRRFWNRLRGRHVVPLGLCSTKRLLLLARDPRDVVVSLHFHLTKRNRRFQGDLPEMLRDPLWGVRPIVDIMNGWFSTFGSLPGFRLVRYEDCRRDPSGTFRGMLGSVGIERIDEAALKSAIEATSFERMQKMEREGWFEKGEMRPGDSADVDSFKVRRGKVGGYVDYLSAEDIAFLEAEIARLRPEFGYSAPASAAPR
jgi:hypothetical protein